jgi:hypothetical protein
MVRVQEKLEVKELKKEFELPKNIMELLKD